MLLPSISMTHAAIWLLSHSSLALSAVAPQSPPAAVTPKSSPSGPGVPPTESAACRPAGHGLMPRGVGASKCLPLAAGNKPRHVSTTFSIADTIGQHEDTFHDFESLTFVLHENQHAGYSLVVRNNAPQQGQGRRGKPVTLKNFLATVHKGESPPKSPTTTPVRIASDVSLVPSQHFSIPIVKSKWQSIVAETNPNQLFMTISFDRSSAPRPRPATIHP